MGWDPRVDCGGDVVFIAQDRIDRVPRRKKRKRRKAMLRFPT